MNIGTRIILDNKFPGVIVGDGDGEMRWDVKLDDGRTLGILCGTGYTSRIQREAPNDRNA